MNILPCSGCRYYCYDDSLCMHMDVSEGAKVSFLYAFCVLRVSIIFMMTIGGSTEK